MKNADMPEMPSDDIDLMAIHRRDGRDESGRYAINRGMTKREYFAAKAMAAYIGGVLANSHPDYTLPNPSFDEVASEALAYADALLEELEKSK